MIEPRYSELAETLGRRSIKAYMQADDQMVVSRQPGAAWPNAGNSFWVSFKGQHWHLCTWAPRCYQVPCGADLVALIERFVDCATSAQSAVPLELMTEFGLVELTLEETEILFGWNERDDQ